MNTGEKGIESGCILETTILEKEGNMGNVIVTGINRNGMARLNEAQCGNRIQNKESEVSESTQLFEKEELVGERRHSKIISFGPWSYEREGEKILNVSTGDCVTRTPQVFPQAIAQSQEGGGEGSSGGESGSGGSGGESSSGGSSGSSSTDNDRGSGNASNNDTNVNSGNTAGGCDCRINIGDNRGR